MRVNEVMTVNPTCCIPSDSARMAATIMRDLDTGIVPIVENDVNRKLIGVVTDRDLCIGLICGKTIGVRVEQHPADTPVDEFMTTNVICCKAEDNIEQAVKLMKENQVRRILVVDSKNAVKGIVSMADLFLRADVPPRETSVTLKSISEPAEEGTRPRTESAQSGK
ncbi:MAG TPA: CBS domain-containing protein [Blastocatellia bacterium]|nr:CBS domain-containing protein [Blastocatellia bacterium]